MSNKDKFKSMKKEIKEDKDVLKDGYIWGNVDHTKQLPKKYLDCYHVYAEKRIIDPSNPTFPIIRSRIVCFQPNQYKLYFEGGPERTSHFLNTMGFTGTSLVWDPTLPGARELHETIVINTPIDPNIDWEKRRALRDKPVTWNDVFEGKV